jgi:hypothetical protein
MKLAKSYVACVTPGNNWLPTKITLLLTELECRLRLL